MLLLATSVQPYPWGRRDGIAAVVGGTPSGGPEAELWVGAHERGPSIVVGGPHDGERLGDVLAADPVRWLGPELAARGAQLPFLLKVLAIGEPLSLQAHPSEAQARAGFAREEAAGIPLDAPERTYRDPSPKPEALVALSPVDALCGFRPPQAAAGLIASCDDASLEPLVEILRAPADADALRGALAWLLHLGGDERAAVARAGARAGAARASEGPPWRWVRALADRHPGDPGCLAPLLLEVLHLEPGEAVHLPAGNLHAYLDGTGVEVMASSDNVLRGGLTTKHVDVDELLAILELAPGVPAPPVVRDAGRVRSYDAGEEAFSLARIEPGARVELAVSRPSLLLPVGGRAVLDRDGEVVEVGAGRAAFVPPGGPVAVVSDAPVWWATTGDGLPD